MKLCILGGGGFRTPHVYQALLADQATPRVTEVALYDVDASRLATMTAILRELGAEHPDAPQLAPTTDLHEAIAGSDFVFAALRVGGLEGRCCDEHVALDLGVLGQETTGPGGLAYAIRTIPVMLQIAQVVKDLAPDAYVLNFTNPAGIITEAMQTVLGDRVLGICDTPSGLGRRVAASLGLDPARVQLDYVGLNHLGWMRRVLHNGRDVLPELLADDAALGALEEGELFGLDWIRTLGVIPNEYLYYYYFTRDAVQSIVAAGATRGDYLRESQTEFYERAAAGAGVEAGAGTGTGTWTGTGAGVDAGAGADADADADAAGAGIATLWRETVDRRSASYMAEARGDEPGTESAEWYESSADDDAAAQGGYAGEAVAVMAAISRNERTTMILNVRNNGTIHGLPDDAVVEVPTTVDANGVHPLATVQPSLHQLGLMQQVKAVERHVIAAATTGSRDEALKAFALHPLVDSVTVARELVSGYIDRIPEVAAVLTR